MKKMICTVGSLLLLVGCGSDLGSSGNSNFNNSNHTPACGDGILDPGESCDDGSANSDTIPDACRTDCRNNHCGDGLVDSGEECEEGDLRGRLCTDFGSNTHGELRCDDECMFDTSQCATCGDGEAEGEEGEPHYETCDGSDLRGEDCVSIGQAHGVLACNSECGWDITGCVGGGGTICGNGVLEPGESCDDGNLTGCDGCSPTCVVEECGNGVIECSEGCDDGNSSNGDHCLNTCVINTCGDGYVNPSTEGCDDGNLTGCDGCSPTCIVEECGNGVIECNEECDDANTDLNDGCSLTCEFDTLILQPGSTEGKDAQISLSNPTTPHPNGFHLMVEVNPTETQRAFLKFSLPPGMQGHCVSIALFYLYKDPNEDHVGTNGLGTQIARVTGSWDEQTISWNTEPTVDTTSPLVMSTPVNTNPVTLLDLTPIVSHWFANPGSNYGFRFKLLDESGSKRVIFASSDHPTSNLHPRLEVTFSDCP